MSARIRDSQRHIVAEQDNRTSLTTISAYTKEEDKSQRTIRKKRWRVDEKWEMEIKNKLSKSRLTVFVIC